MEYYFDNDHIVVTGGAGSLGKAVVNLLVESGADCSVPCMTEEEEQSLGLANHNDVYTEVGVDLTMEDQAQSFYDNAIANQGPLWGSVHLAGGFGMGNIEDTPYEDFNSQIQMNTATCYNACRSAVQRMRQSDYSGGRIVNIAARPAMEPRQGNGMTAYTVAKAGVAALTKSLGAEVAPENILVNALAPSIIDTPQNRAAMPDADFSKWPEPEQIARQIAYLVSVDNEVTRGGVIPVYGKS